MELPQPRHLGTEGRKATHDFLSLYSPVQQDSRPPQGGYLKTQDLLQPLERVGKNATEEENKIEITAIEKSPPPGPPSSVEHVLPGGIGTYSISYCNQRVSKPEGSLFMAQASSTTRSDENQNPVSYAGSGFMLWDESAVKKGQTGKENIAAERHVLRESGLNGVGGQWMSVLEPPSQSSSDWNHNSKTFSPFLSSEPSSSQKNQSFMNMITSATNDQDDDDDNDEECVVKKETTPHLKGNSSIKVEGKFTDQKPNTPRSKHSATEQRRRSKINDRFQRLREIIPHGDQKRDKASFLLEVIEYIQFLQEKVQKCESSYNVWNHEPSKFLQWSKSQVAEGFNDHSRGMNPESNSASVFHEKFDENKTRVSPTIPIIGQNLLEPDTKTATTSQERKPSLITKTAPVLPTKQRNSTSIAASSVSLTPESDADTTSTWPQSHFLHNGSRVTECTVADDKTKKQELTIESGTISISSVYSQELLNTLTQALKNSGIDLSQANISVQIDLGKRVPVSSASTVKDDADDVPTGNKAFPRSRAAITEESGQALKKLRTS